MVKAYVLYGNGIGCHNEAVHAYQMAGAKAELLHFNELLAGRDISDSQILNISGGFMHGDVGGSAIAAANEIATTRFDAATLKELLLEYADTGNLIFGQCNGFQLEVKLGLLPGIDQIYEQQCTLTTNDCGIYRVDFVQHKVAREHYAFEGIEYVGLWCRHGEGKMVFWTPEGSILQDLGEQWLQTVLERHVLMYYVDPDGSPTEQFPYSPNGSVKAIAGLVDPSGNIIGNMAHPEVSVHASSHPAWYQMKDNLRRRGVKSKDLTEEHLTDIGLRVFKNIVSHFR
ncbi:phosphoribosylformylglycinamidine synthase subunit PurQ [Candidatus Woesearchaeota archaeon]|nr:MAG: phosphoribosylformylglycinamidine synthase [archaeon GW2011_AR4]MBS3130635.1 phosphoribosylformylglycinamidine synthase subunit PurQ [Candidatus Woesearchaeota archaeon]HIH39086.1 phosphoribosylformylglycinamidine synthase subunit PurQ [Candidatus Woesearchaeota archaeon]HIH49323.1 phosphoribosylformylglycinamidine synthase subunit PurQ [Candidatus Woesearchaeota archaeon]HIJ03158.1 phosphoribosylformylglycinamidine synthase subunit PurQ [Candidatus Woesearchaeota archaeon]